MDHFVAPTVWTHVVSAVTWLGAAIGFHGFVEPKTENAGISGDRRLARVLGGPFTLVITTASLLTIASGSVLYAHLATTSGVYFFIAGGGIGYTLGALATVLTFGIAVTVTGPSTLGLILLGRTLERSRWEMTPAHAIAFGQYRHRLAIGGRIATALLSVAILAMCFIR